MPRYFFSTTVNHQQRLTELFDFIWPTSVALWNLRWQVNGFLAVCPDASAADLKARFAQGSGIIRSNNLKKACAEESWEEQQSRFARIILFELCSIYESWIESTLGCLRKKTRQNIENLQFPTHLHKGETKGISVALSTIVSSAESNVIRDVFYTKLVASNQKNSLPFLEQLLICYRFFKECRNSLIHSSGNVTQRVVDSYILFSPLSKTDLGVKEAPEALPQALGLPLALTLRGVVGLSDVILRLITTLDAELAKCRSAEQVLIERWEAAYVDPANSNPLARRPQLPSEAKKRDRRLARLLTNANFPEPTNIPVVYNFLKGKNLLL